MRTGDGKLLDVLVRPPRLQIGSTHLLEIHFTVLADQKDKEAHGELTDTAGENFFDDGLLLMRLDDRTQHHVSELPALREIGEQDVHVLAHDVLLLLLHCKREQSLGVSFG